MSSTRRTASKPNSRPQSAKSAADQLADTLSSKLTLQGSAGVGGKERVGQSQGIDDGPKESKTGSMRAVNAASQSLSSTVQSGWKKSTGTTTTNRATLQTTTTTATSALKHIRILRKLCPGDVDVERAAMSVLAKLVGLEMLDFASDLLAETLPSLCTALQLSPISAVSILFPSTPLKDTIHQTLVANYLAYALLLQSLSEGPKPSVQTLARLLDESHSTLLEWVELRQQHLSSIPAKQLDALLTRVYTSLGKFCSAATSSGSDSSKRPATSSKSQAQTQEASTPEEIFVLRSYAVRCLALASPGTIEPDTFWDQARRFGVALAKPYSGPGTAKSEQDRVGGLVLAFCASLEDICCRRVDREAFMRYSTDDETGGEGFKKFCEFWIGFVKRAGDIGTMQRIQRYRDAKSPTSPVTTKEQPEATATPKSPEDRSSAKDQSQTLIREGVEVFNALSNAGDVLDIRQKESDGGMDLRPTADSKDSLNKCQVLLKDSRRIVQWLKESYTSGDEPALAELSRIRGKIERALEKLRRTGLKLVERSATKAESVVGGPRDKSDATAEETRQTVFKLLGGVVGFHSELVKEAKDDIIQRDSATRALDTLFVLSKARLDTSDPQTFIASFEDLALGRTILDSCEPSSAGTTSEPDLTVELALGNLERCLSGAFYNVGVSLYQAGRLGGAVPFLKEAVAGGEKALALQRLSLDPSTEKINKEKEWKHLEEQIHKRWELLAVCYSKNGDRKNAYEAFVQCARTFPYESTNLCNLSDVQPPSIIFDASFDDSSPSASSAQIKYLFSLVDRVTYMAACDLLLPPDDVSLFSLLRKGNTIDPHVIGLVLEKQRDGLVASRWKPGVESVFAALLRDTLRVYSAESGMPIRRARTLLAVLEFAYHGADVTSLLVSCEVNVSNVEVIIKEVGQLCSAKDFAKDADLAAFATQYLIEAKLWTILHTHMSDSADSKGKGKTAMIRAAADAHGLSKRMLSSISQTQGARISLAQRASLAQVQGKSSTPMRVVPKRAAGSSRNVAMVVSPKRTRTRAGVSVAKPPPAPRKAASMTVRTVRRGAAAPVAAPPPVTPKAGARRGGTAVPAIVAQLGRMSITQPRSDLSQVAPSVPFDGFDRLLSLMQLASGILGTAALILPKAQILDVTRKLSGVHRGKSDDAFISASLDLAHDYATLGKTRRALSIFSSALETVRAGTASPEISVLFLLRFAEALAAKEEVEKSTSVYLEAMSIWDRLDKSPSASSSSSTFARLTTRARLLEISGLASNVYAEIQRVKGDLYAELEGRLRALRVFNRAVDIVGRLRASPTPATVSSTVPEKKTNSEDRPKGDPFGMEDMKSALPSSVPLQPESGSSAPRTPLEWTLTTYLITTLLSLSKTYMHRGSPREADYFAERAAEVASGLGGIAGHNARARAGTRRAEVKVRCGDFAGAMKVLEAVFQDLGATATGESLGDAVVLNETDTDTGEWEEAEDGLVDLVDARRLLGEVYARSPADEESTSDPREILKRSVEYLQRLDGMFGQFELGSLGERKSLDANPSAEVLMPDLLATIIRKQLWLLRDEIDQTFNDSLDRLLALPGSSLAKAEEQALLGKLTLHSVCGRFNQDMFLSSLGESAISIPAAVSAKAIEASISTTSSKSSSASKRTLLKGKSTPKSSKRATKAKTILTPARTLVNSLFEASRLLLSHVASGGSRADPISIRSTLLALVKVGSLMSALGVSDEGSSTSDSEQKIKSNIGQWDRGVSTAASVLDLSATLTLRQAMVDAIETKLRGSAADTFDELAWPRIEPGGDAASPTDVAKSYKGGNGASAACVQRKQTAANTSQRARGVSPNIFSEDSGADSDSDSGSEALPMRHGSQSVSKKTNRGPDYDPLAYWRNLRDKYCSPVPATPSLSSMLEGNQEPSNAFDFSHALKEKMKIIPPHWGVLSLGLSEDASVLYISRVDGCWSAEGQEGDQVKRTADPIVMCLPLTDRRESPLSLETPASSSSPSSSDGTALSYRAVSHELSEIIRLSDESTKNAANVKPGDDEARRAWWATRRELDGRMRDLLAGVEGCWLGGFKCLLSPLPNLSEDDLEDLQTMLERMFLRNLLLDNPKKSHKREASKPKPKWRSRADVANPRGGVDDVEMELDHGHEEATHPTPSTLQIDRTFLAFLSTLSTSFTTNTKSKNTPSSSIDDDDLEDIIYFLLDTYHSLGVPFDVAEVDVGLLVVGFKGVLEEWGAKMKGREREQGRSKANRSQRQEDTSPTDPHLFLILDRHLQGLPWENLPIMNGRSASRIPSVDFLVDRIVGAKAKWESSSVKQAVSASQVPKTDSSENVSRYDPSTGHPLDPTRGFFILNPSGDLVRTEERFRGWTEGMRKNGWGGVVGRAVGEGEFLGALGGKDILVYFGHGGGEQYLRTHKIRALPRCAVAMLWGCSSGSLREAGEFDSSGTPWGYMVGGSPTLIANLWDVTDKDIDTFSEAVFDKIGLGVPSTNGPKAPISRGKNPATAVNTNGTDGALTRTKTSIVAAIAQSRDACKLRYLTGAAPVVYGIPFYL